MFPGMLTVSGQIAPEPFAVDYLIATARLAKLSVYSIQIVPKHPSKPTPMEFTRPIAKISLGDMVHQRMITALVSGQFRGGEELNEVALAAQFQVSRTPVREALRRLEAEGLVVNLVNRQATVIEMSRTDVIETYHLRQMLESAAAGLAAEHLGVEPLLELRALANAAAPPAGGQWGHDERRFDAELHRQVAESCGNQRLCKEIVKYTNLVRFVRSRVGLNPERLAQGHAEHLRILSALEARDAHRASAEMSAHIASALQLVLEDLPLH